MSVATPTVTRIQDQHDASVVLGAGVDDYALVWNNATDAFVLSAVAELDTFATVSNSGVDITNAGLRVWQQGVPDYVVEIAAHTSIHDAHGTLTDADIPVSIMRDSEHASDPHTMTIDGVDVSAHAANAAAHHALVSLDANADTLLSLSTQALGLDTQAANRVFAGPTAGAAAVPSFRALSLADLPLATLFALLVVSNGALVTSNGAVTWQN
jgi:hypothetical protein